MSYIYGKLNKQIERVGLSAGETATASVRIEDNVIYVDSKLNALDSVLDLDSEAGVQNKVITNEFIKLQDLITNSVGTISQAISLIDAIGVKLENKLDSRLSELDEFDKRLDQVEAASVDEINAIKLTLNKLTDDINQNIVNLILTKQELNIAISKLNSEYADEIQLLKEADLVINNALEQINNQLNTQLSIISKQINSDKENTDNKISEIESIISVISETVNSINNNISIITGSISNSQSEVDQKINDLTTKQITDVDNLQSQITNVVENITIIDAKADEHYTELSTRIQEEKYRNDENTQQFEALLVAYARLENRPSISLSDVTASINDDNYALKIQLVDEEGNGLGKGTTVTLPVDKIREGLASEEYVVTNINELTQQLNDIATEVTSLNTTVDNKADTDTVITEIAKLESLISTTENVCKEYAEDKDTALKTELETAIAEAETSAKKYADSKTEDLRAIIEEIIQDTEIDFSNIKFIDGGNASTVNLT